MSKRMARCSTVLLAFAVLFAGCSGGDDEKKSENALLGRWNWSKLVVRGVTVNFTNLNLTPGGSTTITPAILSQLGVNGSLSVTFNADNTVTGSVNATIPDEPPVSETGSGTWSVSGDELTVRFSLDGNNIVLKGDYQVSGSRLTIALSNAQLLNLIDMNDADLSRLTPDQRNLLRSLSGEIEFVK